MLVLGIILALMVIFFRKGLLGYGSLTWWMEIKEEKVTNPILTISNLTKRLAETLPVSNINLGPVMRKRDHGYHRPQRRWQERTFLQHAVSVGCSPLRAISRLDGKGTHWPTTLIKLAIWEFSRSFQINNIFS